jgi:glutaredoxin
MQWPQVLTIPRITETYQENAETVKHLPGHFARKQSIMKPPSEVLLYTRTGCHLCEAALRTLEQAGLEVRQIDIDANPELKARYDDCVPVVVIDGRERFRGRIDEMLLRRLLRGRPAS